MRPSLIFLALLLLCQPAPGSAAHWWEAGPALPARTGHVVDEARLLSADHKADLTARLARLETATGHQFVIVTVRSLQGQSIETFGVRLGRTWGIGRKGIDDGVLLIIAFREHKVRIEVGYGLEKRLSDPLCARIIREKIVPRFEKGDLAAGISAGAVAIIGRIGNKRS